jgi:translation machinery-associated protein 16
MPSTFEKTRKAIAKKKGPIEAVHQLSRDSKRLHRAQARDEKLEKIAAARRKADQPFREFALPVPTIFLSMTNIHPS